MSKKSNRLIFLLPVTLLFLAALFAAAWIGKEYILPQKEGQEQKLLSRNKIEFGGNLGKPGFSVSPPVGWAKGEELGVDLAIGSVIGEKTEKGDFTPNIVFVIDKHDFGQKNIGDYEKNWDKIIKEIFPDVEILDSYRKRAEDVDMVIQERVLVREDGLRVRQLQYVFFINEEFGLWATGSAPEQNWNKYEEAIRASIESVKQR